MSSFNVNIILLSACLVYSATTDAPLISKTMMGVVVLCLIYNMIHFAAMLFTSSHLRKALTDEEKGFRFASEMFKQKLIPIKFKTDDWYLEFSKKQILVYILATIFVALRVNLYQFIISCIVFDVVSFILFFEQTKILNILLVKMANKRV